MPSDLRSGIRLTSANGAWACAAVPTPDASDLQDLLWHGVLTDLAHGTPYRAGAIWRQALQYHVAALRLLCRHGEPGDQQPLRLHTIGQHDTLAAAVRDLALHTQRFHHQVLWLEAA